VGERTRSFLRDRQRGKSSEVQSRTNRVIDKVEGEQSKRSMGWKTNSTHTLFTVAIAIRKRSAFGKKGKVSAAIYYSEPSKWQPANSIESSDRNISSFDSSHVMRLEREDLVIRIYDHYGLRTKLIQINGCDVIN